MANYTVKISGWQGKLVMADGSNKDTKLFCMGDKMILENTLQAMRNNGLIQSFEIVWADLEVPAG